MRLRQKADRLELTDAVGCYAMLIIFVAVMAVIAYVGLFDLTRARQPTWLRIAGYAAMIVPAALVLYVAEQARTTTIAFIEGARQIVIEKRRPLSRRGETLLVDLRDVEECFVDRNTDSDGDSFYYVALRLRNGEVIRLSEIGEGASAAKEKAATAVNEYLTRAGSRAGRIER